MDETIEALEGILYRRGLTRSVVMSLLGTGCIATYMAWILIWFSELWLVKANSMSDWLFTPLQSRFGLTAPFSDSCTLAQLIPSPTSLRSSRFTAVSQKWAYWTDFGESSDKHLSKRSFCCVNHSVPSSIQSPTIVGSDIGMAWVIKSNIITRWEIAFPICGTAINSESWGIHRVNTFTGPSDMTNEYPGLEQFLDWHRPLHLASLALLLHPQPLASPLLCFLSGYGLQVARCKGKWVDYDLGLGLELQAGPGTNLIALYINEAEQQNLVPSEMFPRDASITEKSEN